MNADEFRRSFVGTWESDPLMVSAANPATPGHVLASALRFVDRVSGEPTASPAGRRHYTELRATILRNPNLPADLLREAMGEGEVDAWLNPAVPLLLLENPMPDEERLDGLWKALCKMALVPSYERAPYTPGKSLSAEHLRRRPGWDDLRARYPDDIRHLVHDPL